MGRFQIRQFKQVEQKTVTLRQTDILVFGHHTWCEQFVRQARQAESDASLFWAASRPVVSSWPGPSLLRGEQTAAFFFKDQQWKEFGGRSKSELLLRGEEYFTRELLLSEESERQNVVNVSENIEEYRPFVANVVSIHRQDEQWLVKLSTGDQWQVKRLVWGESPERFLQVFQEKALFTESDLTMLSLLKGQQALFVEYIFPVAEALKAFQNLPLNGQSTFFIPLSYTHAFGHFICQWQLLADGRALLKVCHLLNSDDENEEELSKKIKMLKKGLEKSFGVNTHTILEEHVFVEDDLPDCFLWHTNTFSKEFSLDKNLKKNLEAFHLEFVSPHFSYWEENWQDVHRQYFFSSSTANVQHADNSSDELLK